jgi:6-phosphofructokinase 1
VIVSALRPAQGASPAVFGFPEAGPRSHLCFSPSPDKRFKVAVLVVGGIAPGINAVIDGIVQRHWLYADKGKYPTGLEIHGLINGVHAFDDLDNSHRLLVSDAKRLEGIAMRLETPPHAHEGGSILGTCRDDELMKEPGRDTKLRDIVHQLRNFDILYVIGGDGGMRMAHAIRSYAIAEGRTGDRELSVVAVPKTMDNDILWVWQSFGFMSAVEKAREVIEHVHTEITSNPRLGIVQLFGSVSGFVVSHAVVAGSTPNCYLALVPEVPFNLKKVATYLKTRLVGRGTIPGGLLVMAETALPTDALKILEELDKNHARSSEKGGGEPVLTEIEATAVREFLALQQDQKTLTGQTSDELRSACLKIVSRGLECLLKKDAKPGSRWSKLRVVTNEPRHIIRAIPPSCQDIITGRRLGSLAVDNAMAGYTDFMISQWLTEFVLVPLPLVVLGRKKIHREGIFWKSVLAKTGSWDCFEPHSSNGAAL